MASYSRVLASPFDLSGSSVCVSWVAAHGCERALTPLRQTITWGPVVEGHEDSPAAAPLAHLGRSQQRCVIGRTRAKSKRDDIEIGGGRIVGGGARIIVEDVVRPGESQRSSPE